MIIYNNKSKAIFKISEKREIFYGKLFKNKKK